MFRRLIAVLLAATLGAAAVVSLVWAVAAWLGGRDSPGTVSAAIRLAPGDAALWLRLAALGGPERGRAFEAAIERNPLDTSARIGAGLEAELRGDTALARRRLIEAAQRDRTFEPRWTLAGFAFRQGDSAGYRKWASQAAQWCYTDPEPLFRMAWSLSAEAAANLSLFSDNPAVLARYTAFLATTGRVEEALAAAALLLSRPGPGTNEAVLDTCDYLLAAGRGRQARQLWNHAVTAGLIPAAPLDPERGAMVTNGAFHRPVPGRGFDWRIASIPGVSFSRHPGGSGLRISLSGDQPEAADLLAQWIPVTPRRSYLLSVTYRADVQGPDGFEWDVSGAGPVRLAAGPGTQNASIVFRAAADADTLRIVLRTRRQPGSVPPHGDLLLENVSATPAVQ